MRSLAVLLTLLSIATFSPNVAMSAVTRATSTNFQVYATPGKAYKIPVRRGEKVVQFEVCCNPAK